MITGRKKVVFREEGSSKKHIVMADTMRNVELALCRDDVNMKYKFNSFKNRIEFHCLS